MAAPKEKMKYGLPGEQNLYNSGLVLTVEHVPTGYTVEFSAFMEDYSDAYTSEWNDETVFGRMDPIATFQSTRRAISVAWKVPSSSPEQAVVNINKVNRLLKFLYPLYKRGSSEVPSVMNMGPLVRVKFGNLIYNSATGGPLMGYLRGITTQPIVEDGVYSDAGSGVLGTKGPEYLPKTFRLNFELTVLHEHALGFVKSTAGNVFVFQGAKKGFPYEMPTSTLEKLGTTSNITEVGHQVIEAAGKSGQQSLDELKQQSGHDWERQRLAGGDPDDYGDEEVTGTPREDELRNREEAERIQNEANDLD